MGDVLDAEANIDRPGSATVQRSAMLKVHSIRLKKKKKALEKFCEKVSNPSSLIFQESQFFQLYELCLQGPPLGEGSFSVCRRCKHRQSGQEYAVKIVSRR